MSDEDGEGGRGQTQEGLFITAEVWDFILRISNVC